VAKNIFTMIRLAFHIVNAPLSPNRRNTAYQNIATAASWP